jgi:hypothetical protein
MLEMILFLACIGFLELNRKIFQGKKNGKPK